MGELIILADRRPASFAFTAAMRAVAEFTRPDFREDKQHAAGMARSMVERRLYGSPARLRQMWIAYRFAQSMKDYSVREQRINVLMEIERIRLTRKLVGPKAKFQPSERVETFGHRCRYGVVERVYFHTPARGEAHFRYWVRMLDGGHIDAAEGNLSQPK